MENLFYLLAGYFIYRALGVLSTITDQIADILEQIGATSETPDETQNRKR